MQKLFHLFVFIYLCHLCYIAKFRLIILHLLVSKLKVYEHR